MLVDQKSFESILEINNAASLKPFKGERFKVYRNLKESKGGLKDVIEFENGKYHMIDARKNHYIELGEYLITFGSHHGEENYLDMKYSHLYRIRDGKEFPVSVSGTFYSGCLVVLDKKMIAICNKTTHPQFLIVMNNDLLLIPCLTAEQIIRNFVLNEMHINSLVKMFPENGWKNINNIPINPETLDVPSSFHVMEWRKRTRGKKIRYDYKMSTYFSTLQRDEKKETPQIKFINSQNF